MALWVCGGCSCRYSVGAPACPQCGSVDHHEEGADMAKITAHGGPTTAGPAVVGAAWSDNDEPDTWPASPDTEPSVTPDDEQVIAQVSVDGVDQGPGEVDETASDFKPLPEAVEGDTAERVSEPDYTAWTVEQLREELGNRGLTRTGNKPELVERLAQHDADTADQAQP